VYVTVRIQATLGHLRYHQQISCSCISVCVVEEHDQWASLTTNDSTVAQSGESIRLKVSKVLTLWKAFGAKAGGNEA
jgi:hypothetical protein